MAYKSFQYRIYPNDAQKERMEIILEMSRCFYNMALENRKLMYDVKGVKLSRFDSYKFIKHYKRTFKARIVHSHVLQAAVDRLYEAYNTFFERVKKGEKGGYPRFKGRKDWNTFEFKEYGNGFSLSGRRLRMTGVGRVRVRWHRPCEGKIKTCSITRKSDGWYVSFVCEVNDPKPLPKTGRAIGLDVGILSLITTSDGAKLENPRWYRRAEKRLAACQAKVSHAQKGSRNRHKKLLTLRRQSQHIANQRKDFIDRVVFELIRDYDLIAIEDLQVVKMSQGINMGKSIMDAGWGYFRTRLQEKAIDAGRQVVLVDPAYTSKTCSGCGRRFEDLPLSQRWVNCECGLSLDRDHNAAINILHRALAQVETAAAQ